MTVVWSRARDLEAQRGWDSARDVSVAKRIQKKIRLQEANSLLASFQHAANGHSVGPPTATC